MLSKGLSKVFSNTSSKASILQCSDFFRVQLSHPYTTTGKTIALTRRTFVGKVMSLLLNMLSMLVITFLPRSKRLLISWLQSPSAVIMKPKTIKSATLPLFPLFPYLFAMKWQNQCTCMIHMHQSACQGGLACCRSCGSKELNMNE